VEIAIAMKSQGPLRIPPWHSILEATKTRNCFGVLRASDTLWNSQIAAPKIGKVYPLITEMASFTTINFQEGKLLVVGKSWFSHLDPSFSQKKQTRRASSFAWGIGMTSLSYLETWKCDLRVVRTVWKSVNVTFLKKHKFRIGDDRCLFRHDMHPRFTHVRSNSPYKARPFWSETWVNLIAQDMLRLPACLRTYRCMQIWYTYIYKYSVMQCMCTDANIYDLYTCFQAPPQEKKNHTSVVTSFGFGSLALM